MEIFSLVISTHYRHKYLERALDYYSSVHFSFPILVFDSSSKEFTKSYPNLKLHYNHVPDLPYIEKMILASESVKSLYVAICADDDFMIQDGIQKCCQFLNDHQDYASVQGHVTRFMNFGELVFSPDEFHSIGEDICHESEKERIIYGMLTNFVQTFFSVYRSEVLKKILSNSKGLNFHMMEYFVVPLTYYFGKHKVIPHFYLLRENVLTSYGKTATGIEGYAVYNEDKRDFRHLIKILAETSEIEPSFFEEIFHKFLLNFDPLIFEKKANQKKAWGKFKKLIIPYYLKLKEMSKKRNFHLEVENYKAEAKKKINESKTIPGFPFFDEEAKRQLIPILTQIERHNIS